MSEIQHLKNGVVKRTRARVQGLFIDGVNLDRATRRIGKRVDWQQLINGVSSGLPPICARYYTIIPHEDDSRQRSFLDAVGRAGLEVVVKRLPPKGVNRQVSTDIEMSADLVAFAAGRLPIIAPGESAAAPEPNNLERVAILVCPSPDMGYAISLSRELGIDTVVVDFGAPSRGDMLKSANKWVDLSDSETIWTK